MTSTNPPKAKPMDRPRGETTPKLETILKGILDNSKKYDLFSHITNILQAQLLSGEGVDQFEETSLEVKERVKHKGEYEFDADEFREHIELSQHMHPYIDKIKQEVFPGVAKSLLKLGN